MSATFLNSVFGTVDPWLVRGHYGTKLNIKEEGRGIALLDQDDAFYCVAELKPGATSRSIGNAVKVHVLVIDDVGTLIDRDNFKLACPLKPSFAVETSPGNFQVGFIIDGGMEVEEYNALREAMETHPLWGKSHGKDAVHIFRLPFGTNTKPQHNGAKPKLAAGGYHRYSQAEVRLLAGAAVIRAPSPKPTAQNDYAVESEEALRALLALIPNPPGDTRPYWTSVGHYTYGAFGSGGYDAFEEWSARHASHDAGKCWTFWDTIKPSDVRSRGGKLRELAEDADREGFDAWRQKYDIGRASKVFADDAASAAGFDAAAYVLPNASTLQRRPWLYGRRLMRGYLSSTVAAGGVGKSSLVMTEIMAMVTGRDLIGAKPRAPLRVWLWNGEDDMLELSRRMVGIGLRYNINASDLGDRLYIDSGRDKPIIIAAADGKGTMVNAKGVEAIKKVIRDRRIDVMVLDPFVSAHKVSENDNMAIDLVAKTLSAIAGECHCAIDLVHHTRKPGNGAAGAASVDDSRGASALPNATRHSRVVSFMTKPVGDRLGITNLKQYICIQHDATKANMVPASAGATWYKMESVGLGNGDLNPADGLDAEPEDEVGVVTRWTPPSVTVMDDPVKALAAQAEIAKGSYRESPKAPDWVGPVIARVLGVDLNEAGVKKLIVDVIDAWVKRGWLVVVEKMDITRHKRTFIEVGSTPKIDDVFDDEGLASVA